MRKTREDMRKKAGGIETCGRYSLPQMVSFLCEHYTVMEPMISNYRDKLISAVMDQKARSHGGENEGLGVRIQIAFCNQSNPTEREGMNRLLVAKAIDEGYLDEDFFEGTEDREALIGKVTSYHLVNVSYQRFIKKLREMDPRDLEVILPYIRREKSIDALADELKIDYHSVIKRIQRIKKKLAEGMNYENVL